MRGWRALASICTTVLAVLLESKLCICQYIRIVQVDSNTNGRLSKAFNNPYHPEDDIEDLSDIDGDNLGYRKEDVEEKIKAIDSESKNEKKLKINGKYFEIKSNRYGGALGYDSE